MSPRRALPTLLMTAVLVVASVLALGRPELGLVAGFFSGGYPSLETAIAVVSVLCYVVVTAMALFCIVQSLRAATEIQQKRRRSSRAAMFLIAGAIVLGLSVAQRTTPHVSFCCGDAPQDIREAASLAR